MFLTFEIVNNELNHKKNFFDMEALQIVDVIRQLPLTQKLFILELVFKDIRTETLKKEIEEQQRKEAAKLLLADYQNDEELTAFTVLDKDNFYETNLKFGSLTSTQP